MSRKKNKTNLKNQKAFTKKSSTEPKSKKDPKNSLPRQLLVSFAFFILLSVLINKVKGYQWVYNGLLKPNLKMIDKFNHLTYEQKLSAKLGFNYNYLKYIVDNTPEDAIIIMPPEEAVFPKNRKTQFKKVEPHIMTRKAVCSYFVYPRKLVFESEKDTSKMYPKATHVAIVNSWGYDKLNYKVGKKVDNTVLPINQNPQ